MPGKSGLSHHVSAVGVDIRERQNFFRKACGPGWVLLDDAHYKKDQLATFAPPAPDMLAMYTALQDNQEDTDAFFGLIT
jgi:hypothetical protein